MAKKTRKEALIERFQAKIEGRNSAKNSEDTIEPSDYHPVFSEMEDMELGEEIKDDVWTIIKVPGGWIVKRLNFGAVFVPQT